MRANHTVTWPPGHLSTCRDFRQHARRAGHLPCFWAVRSFYRLPNLVRGKQEHDKLVQILEKLRPVGQLPPEPLPREWYAYTILYDSYVKDCLSRDIMGKLYIGEGTYYRLRRQALRGITRAVVEMGVGA